MLLAYLPESGQFTGKQAASLAGLARFARDSSSLRGQRRVCGGRAKVRLALLHVACAGLRHNPVLKAFYGRLVSRAEPGTLGLTDCMHKTLLIRNAMLGSKQTWRQAAS